MKLVLDRSIHRCAASGSDHCKSTRTANALLRAHRAENSGSSLGGETPIEPLDGIGGAKRFPLALWKTVKGQQLFSRFFLEGQNIATEYRYAEGRASAP